MPFCPRFVRAVSRGRVLCSVAPSNAARPKKKGRHGGRHDREQEKALACRRELQLLGARGLLDGQGGEQIFHKWIIHVA